MAAVVENTENGQLGKNLTYSQSSDGSLHSSETLRDSPNPSAKAVDFNPGQKLNGLSHVDEDPQLQKTGANILGPGTVKAYPQHTLINCSVVKTEIDFGEKPKPEEVVVAALDAEGQPTVSQSVRDEIPLPEAGSSPSIKDEEKVEFEVPLDSKSNCSLSIQNAENKLSLCDDVDGTKTSWVSGIEEQKDEIDSKIPESKTAEPLSSSENPNNTEPPLISESKTTIITSTLEDKNLKSNFPDNNKLFKSVENISLHGNTDSNHLQEDKTISSKSATDHNATLNKDSADISTIAEGKPSEETNLNNSSESSNCQNYSECLSNSKTDKSSGVSNIPELLSYCSPCQVVVQDFFKELNIDLLELSRNFPVHHSHRKRLKNSKSVPSKIPGKEKIKNNLFDSLDRTKQAKCYTENSKRRKKHLTQDSESFKEPVEDEDEEDNLPLLSVRNNLTQAGNTAADTKKSGTETKSNDNDDKITEGENLTSIPTKGDNSDATEERSVTKCVSSDLLSSTSTDAEAADSFPKKSVINVPPTVNISDSNDLGLKIVSVSSQGSVFFPAFTSDNSENIVFGHSETASKLNGELDETCENSTAKLSPPKCKFHGPNSSPIQNLYKCKKCGLEAKNLSDIQAHMAGSHSEFCMYRCPFCIHPLPVKRVGIFNNRPIEFEVLRESTHKLTPRPPSTKTSSSSISSKRKLPRHIRIQCEKRRKLNYYYRNQREIKKYKNEKVSCEYCHKEINQSNISRHQNSKICTNPDKNKKRSLMLRDMIPTKYQKVKCGTCQKSISRTNLSKHSRICQRESDD